MLDFGLASRQVQGLSRQCFVGSQKQKDGQQEQKPGLAKETNA